MSKKCSCCGMIGHNIIKCNDPEASKELYELFNDESIESAMARVEQYPPSIVSFILSRGFGVSINGKIDALRELVRSSYISPDETIAALEEERQAEERRLNMMQRMDEIRQIKYAEMIEKKEEEKKREEEEEYSETNYQMLKIATSSFDYRRHGLLKLMPEHPLYNEFSGENAIYLDVYQIMHTVVNQTLDTIFTSKDCSEISYLLNKDFHLSFSEEAINHLMQVSQMINFKRILNRH